MTENSIVTLQIAFNTVDRGYLDEIEDSIAGLSLHHKGIQPGIPSASERTDGTTIETFSLVVKDVALVDELASVIVSELRRIGIRNGYLVTISKRVVGKQHIEVFTKPVFQNRDTKWEKETVGKHGASPVSVLTLPERIEYLATVMETFYRVGGKDPFGLLPGSEEPLKFWDSLPKDQQHELKTAYLQITSRDDAKWINGWMTSYTGKDVSMEREKAIYLLALLERLAQAKVFSPTKAVNLVDWDSFV